MHLASLPDLLDWARGRCDLRGKFLVLGQEALWIPETAASADLAATLRYFVGGLPREWLLAASAALRGVGAEPPAGCPPTAAAGLVAAVRADPNSITALGWTDTITLTVTGTNRGGLPTGRLAPAAVVSTANISIGTERLSLCVSRSLCPEPTFETSDRLTWRPELRSMTLGVDHAETQERALGEALERYALGTVPFNRLSNATAYELDSPFLDPSTFLAYSPRQRERQGLAEFAADRAEWWVCGRDLGGRNDTRAIPAAIIFAPFPYIPQWTNAGVQNSSGTAFHPDPDRAVQTAWLELVERDAFLRAWRLSWPMGAVRRRHLPQVAVAVCDWITMQHRRNTVVVAALASPTGVPVWAVFATGPTIGVCVGSAAGNFERSVTKAACECLAQTMFSIPALENQRYVRAPHEHAGYYRFAGRYAEAERELLARLSAPATDFPPCKDPTPRGVAVDLDVPWPFPGAAARVVDASLIPMTFGFDTEPVGRLRQSQPQLYDVDEHSDVAAPHPFP